MDSVVGIAESCDLWRRTYGAQFVDLVLVRLAMLKDRDFLELRLSRA